MTHLDENGPVPGGDDIVAAEYVVGLLEAEERAEVAARLERDAAFARLVDEWEVRLSPMAEAYPSAQPPADAKHGIDRMLFSSEAASTRSDSAARAGLWQSIAFWRGLTVAALALVAIAIIVPLVSQPRPGPAAGPQYVASISPKDSDVSYLAYYDAKTGQLSLSHVSGERGSGHDFELWAIEGQAKPVSLGVIPTGKSIKVKVGPALESELAKGGVLAISLEPPGGSPTGQATGPVVAVGGLQKI